jgi:hypothetical protein
MRANSICSACEVELHQHCITVTTASDPEPVYCHCAATTHTIQLPAWLAELVGGNNRLKQTYTHPRGQMRDVDYDLEPFEQVGPKDKGKGGKYGKPQDDILNKR